ncbi:hypothetical protein IU510_25815 [Nocardia cyriacigeorgica]|uniref:hypothetical protein n=1 Tax=Nocardia cyriacigeorgica TaxID=135487 RepID=UPI00189576A4|nr:hypothetical protein [Nocardia cyriacigeorgica]MBF6101443.1 hypothetical protein [Nocardia cyriacigeorgica]MBF6162163.1 hypothetical protein [Nocardia cyriacigeorgica]MBF6200775.1 hypothetical protein [Nocardia cyriacigeorgica]
MTNPLSWNDIRVFEPDIAEDVATAMIAAAWARARKLAPCLTDPETELDADAIEILRSALRSAVLRWHETGSGAVVQRQAGDYAETLGRDTTRGGLFRPDEIRDLLGLCGSGRSGGASTIPTWPEYAPPSAHPFLLG